MDRVVATYRVDSHEVVIVESVEDEGTYFHVMVDGLEGEETFAVPPSAEELTRIVDRRLGW
ncbi:hypothetical protein ABN034_32585 [Actinopolymorpha sp. B11F2]|uniref:hypothetical protein n=1 Tax=Actinopolymorpha sp. B11F2 TaxID=3160862 RepID=UPI0032E4C17A